MPEIEIRLLTDGDVEAFWQLRLEALEQEPEAFGESAAEHLQRTRSLPVGRSFVFGAFASERLIGTAGFFRSPQEKTSHKGRIWGVYVSGDYRGRGVGRRLLSELLQKASQQPDLEQVQLSVRTPSHAKELYLSLGFEVFGVERAALKIGGTYIDESHMVWQVPR